MLRDYHAMPEAFPAIPIPNAMKYLLTILLTIGTFLGVSAQSSKPERIAKPAEFIPLDSSFVEILYEYIVHDPVLDETREDYKLFEIGRNYSKYYDYGAYQLDSVMEVDYPDGLVFSKFLKLPYHPTWEATIKDLKAGITRTYDKVFIDRYVYEEPMNAMKWSLAPGSEMICGYKCRKATTSFRGRKWTAWYAPEIPVDNGPWKFGGLPGLILKTESDDGDQKFEAVSLHRNGHKIGLKKFWYQTTTREKYNAEFKEYKTTPRQYHIANPTMAPKDKDGNIATSEFRRLFFNPIELE